MDRVTTVPGVVLTPLKLIANPAGDVLHCIKHTDPTFQGFGEAYFSMVQFGSIKGWKRHRKMTLNLVVPVGEIKFIIVNLDPTADARPSFFEVNLSRDNYQRLTVAPGLWVGFQGLSKETNLLLNVADLAHDPAESDQLDLSDPRMPDSWDALA